MRDQQGERLLIECVASQTAKDELFARSRFKRATLAEGHLFRKIGVGGNSSGTRVSFYHLRQFVLRYGRSATQA